MTMQTEAQKFYVVYTKLACSGLQQQQGSQIRDKEGICDEVGSVVQLFHKLHSVQSDTYSPKCLIAR